MEARVVNQFGEKSIYIERNEGNIYYVGGSYVEEPSSAFLDGSYELQDYTPSIKPAILREEVGEIEEWIEQEDAKEDAERLALLSGKAGIGKSIVMHDLLERLQTKEGYLVLGLKSDQVEFVDADDLSRKLHLAKPIEKVVGEMARQYHRVVLLIDQIDALSLSLSSNRTPLRSLLRVINQLLCIPNVRVVISCRPYDLEYDPMLYSLQTKNKWELKELSREQVEQTLRENHCNERLSERLLLFLGNPLHLYLFIKIHPCEQLTDPLSTDLLYHQLWRKYVSDDDVRVVEKKRLLSLLDGLVNAMYDRQELSVHIREFETEYNAELRYLLSAGLLVATKGGHIQFFHQTLFDYIYARRFTERGMNLLEVLKSQHQGLFSRAAVKSILMFQREQNPTEYIKTIERLLYNQDERGKDRYRFHLKSLALSQMAYFDSPITAERSLISRKIFSDRLYMNVIFESISTASWFEAVWEIIESRGGWRALGREYKEKVIVMCRRCIGVAGETVLDRLDSSLDYSDDTDCAHMGDLLQNYHIECGCERLTALYNKMTKGHKGVEYTYLLLNILRENPAFVCSELKRDMEARLESSRERFVHKIELDHGVRELYKELLGSHRNVAIGHLIDVLTLIHERTQWSVEGQEICASSELSHFQRGDGHHFISSFAEDATNVIINELLKDVESDKTQRLIADLSRSKYGGLVLIALHIYTSRPDLFKDAVCDIITTRQVLTNAPCWVEYQAVEALRVTFPLMNDTQKQLVIDRILSTNDSSERMRSLYNSKDRALYGVPITREGLHKGKLLRVIDKEELRRLSWNA